MLIGVHGSEREHFTITGAVSGRFKAFSERFLVQLLKLLNLKSTISKYFFAN
jgi:hypothetical protein